MTMLHFRRGSVPDIYGITVHILTQ